MEPRSLFRILEMKNMSEFYCITCGSLHTLDSGSTHVRILSTGFHIVDGTRYQICICGCEAQKPVVEAGSTCDKIS